MRWSMGALALVPSGLAHAFPQWRARGTCKAYQRPFPGRALLDRRIGMAVSPTLESLRSEWARALRSVPHRIVCTRRSASRADRQAGV
jgi:hypothetical protein